MTPLLQNIKKSWGRICAILFPEHCHGCEKPGSMVCSSCLSVAFDPYESKNILSVFAYRNPGIKSLLWAQKFHGNERVAKTFAPFLYDMLLGKISEESIHYGGEYETQKILLVPIPLSKKRKRERGYNQAQKLTKAIASFGGNNIFCEENALLSKNRETIPQSQTKNKVERLKNLKDCFSVKMSESLAENTIVLVDDITTTGATFHEAEKTLKEAGAKEVICLAVAH